MFGGVGRCVAKMTNAPSVIIQGNYVQRNKAFHLCNIYVMIFEEKIVQFNIVRTNTCNISFNFSACNNNN